MQDIRSGKFGDFNQIVLIISGAIATALFAIFFYREIFPEYRMYQKAYEQLEEFRSSYTGRPVPLFEGGVKQIVLLKEDRGPETIDRCISCHVAMKYTHFSETQPSYDINGNLKRDEDGKVVLEKNPDYIFLKLEEKIAETEDSRERERLEALKIARVGEHEYDMKKVLAQHPLIGKETRPFELHSMEEYGCTSCHGGNGRGLVTDRAHGPVVDGEYEETFMGPEPEFLESDPKNDPFFSKLFNHKPGHRLLFQTEPILMGSLIEANCVQCHQGGTEKLIQASSEIEKIATEKKETVETIREAIFNELSSLRSLLNLKEKMSKESNDQIAKDLDVRSNDYSLPGRE